MDDAYTIRNNLLMNVRGGFTRQMFPERRRSQGVRSVEPGLLAARWSRSRPKDTAAFPFVNYDGFQDFSVSESGDGCFTTDVYYVTGSLMWLVGRHNMKYGTEYRNYIEDAQPLLDRLRRRRSTSATPGRAARSTIRRRRRSGRTSRHSCSGCRPAAR